MSKEKSIEKEIHLLYKLKMLDSMLYSSIQTTRNIFKDSTLDAAIKNFMETFNLTEDEFSLESGKQTYNRINNYIKKHGLWPK